jgi:hypothetical protein
MKRKKKWVYYCEFCKKHYLSAASMAIHEKICTLNPDRGCGMCEAAGLGPNDAYKAVEVLKREGIESLHDYVDACPACMLAAVRLSGLQDDDSEKGDEVRAWSYSTAKDDFWKQVNADQMGQDSMAHGGIY